MAATRFNPSGRVRRRSIASFVGLISVLGAMVLAGAGPTPAPEDHATP